MSNKRIEIKITYKPWWGLGFLTRIAEWSVTASETMTDADVYELAHKFLTYGVEVNVVEDV